MCDFTQRPVRCNVCGEYSHPEDIACACQQTWQETQTKTVTLPLKVALRIETGDETWDDMQWLRDRLSAVEPDMIF